MIKPYLWQPAKYLELIRLAIPLVLSSSGLVLMQFCDAVFLSWYSPQAVAAVGTSSMTAWGVSSFIFGITGYTSPFVANLIGAGAHKDVGKVVWQGIYVALISGVITLLLAPLSLQFFLLCGHENALAQSEATYLRILMVCSVFQFIQNALAGFFSGRGDNVRLMFAQVAGQIFNVVGDYGLIFGKWGLPEMGIAGAAIATALSAAIPSVILFIMFVTKKNRQQYHTLKAWRFAPQVFKKLLIFGTPNGLLFFINATLWTLFLMLIGKIGVHYLAASSIVFRINGLAFMPVVGIAKGSATTIGRSHGARNPTEVMHYTCHSVVLCTLWMTALAMSYLFAGGWYMDFFRSNQGDFQTVFDCGVVLLRFVAVYTIVDGINISLTTMLQTVGDTKWTAIVCTLATLALVGALIIASAMHSGIYTLWGLATAYIALLPIAWILRIRGGKWRSIVVAAE